MRSVAAAAGTLAAIGLATPVVVAVLIPGLPIALAAAAYYQWREAHTARPARAAAAADVVTARRAA